MEKRTIELNDNTNKKIIKRIYSLSTAMLEENDVSFSIQEVRFRYIFDSV